MDKITDDLNKLVNMYSGSGDFIKHIEKYSKEHKENFNEIYKGFWAISETSIEILNLTLEILKHSNRKNWEGYYGTQYLLILNSIPFLYGAYKNITDGFYIQSSLNLRGAFESLLRLYFINFHSTDFNKIFGNEAKRQLKEEGKKIKDYPDFKITDFIKDDLKTPKWLDIYNILSNESHSNMISVVDDMAKIENGDYDIFTDMKGKINVEFHINILFMIIYGFFRYVDDVLIKNTFFDKQDLEKHKNEIFKTKDFLIKILEKSLLDQYRKEINSIMEMILDNKVKN